MTSVFFHQKSTNFANHGRQSNAIFRKLCYWNVGKISKESISKSCVNRRLFKVFSGRHPTVLPSLKIQKQKKRGNAEDTGTKEKKQEVKCASTNTGLDLKCICFVPIKVNKFLSKYMIYVECLFLSKFFIIVIILYIYIDT